MRTRSAGRASPEAPRRVATAAALVLLAATAAGARALPERPPPGHTGGFGEPSCHACHFDAGPNAPGGALRIEGLPERVRAGGRYRVAVVLTHPAMARAGFQLAARRADGARAGAQAGTLRPLDARAAVSDSAGVAYLHHTLAGTGLPAAGTARWEAEWTAPAEPGRVLLHAAANAADDDASPFGDLVYLTAHPVVVD